MASVVADGFGISGRSGLFRLARPDHLVQAVRPSVLVLADAPGRVLALRISRFYYISLGAEFPCFPWRNTGLIAECPPFSW